MNRGAESADVEPGIMHNVEFKVELRDLDLARAICRRLGATPIASFEQIDTYFAVASGRLKRRETQGEPAEYIFYERANRTRPKLSHFSIYSEAQATERFGASPLPTLVVVRKFRELYMLGSTRIHLDQVDGLGTFLEFESLVSRENNLADAHATIATLRQQFGPALGEAISVSYSDLLLRDIEDAQHAAMPPAPDDADAGDD